jgi:exonuclease VII small subunit
MSVKNDLSISEKIAQLDALVSWFDGDEFELETALDKFTAAEKLAAEIETDLSELKNDIAIIKAKFDEEE